MKVYTHENGYIAERGPSISQITEGLVPRSVDNQQARQLKCYLSHLKENKCKNGYSFFERLFLLLFKT